MYVEELIGPDTVDTVPPATFEAFRRHGRPRASLEEDVAGAQDTLAALDELGISLEEITDRLTADGVDLFTQAFQKLSAAIAAKLTQPAAHAPSLRADLPPEIETEVRDTIEDWRSGGKVKRLWAGDRTLWTGADESEWLGWLHVAEDQLAHSERLDRIARDVAGAGFDHVLLLGMGGSSLCPELLSLTFPRGEGHPELRILDSTDPAQVSAREHELDLTRTVCIVSSKSGTTLEPNIFEQYFFERMREAVGAEEAPRRFIAITDPGSKLEQLAEEKGFRHVAHGLASIGGRYSALSDFGMLPGAVMGLDVQALLDRAERMAHSCSHSVPAADNPGLVLGSIIGVCARLGRDKLTLVASPAIADLGAWLEQLLAESTGKDGRGVIPIDREPLGPPDVYGDDRLFVYVRLGSSPDDAQDAAIDALEAAGHPVVRIGLDDLYDIGGELFRWEFATAVAGSVIGINPFDQPDVEASKVVTRELTAGYEQHGKLADEEPIATFDGVSLYADERNAAELSSAGRRGHARGNAESAPRPDRSRRLRGAARIHRDDPRSRAGTDRDPADDQGSHASGHLRRLRAAFPALHRTGVQGRAQLGRLPPDHLRRRPRPAGAGAQVHLRCREGRPGSGGLPGPGRARPARASNPHRRGRRRRPGRDPPSCRAGAAWREEATCS